jgi:hypothetical protein
MTDALDRADSAIRELIAHALRTGSASPDFLGRETKIIAVATSEGVLPLLEHRLRGMPDWDRVPQAFQTSLIDGARNAAVQDLFRTGEMRRISSLLAREGLQVLLLKGNALGQWLYPAPYLRICGDIDLLLDSRASAEQASAACEALGYRLQFKPAASNYEMTARLVVDGVKRSELDLHCRLVNAAAYADIFGFEELWGESIDLPGLGSGLRGLSLRHALAHSCLNRALDMQIGVADRLKLLYDIHLMAQHLDAAGWDGLVDMALRKGISGACLRSIDDTAAMFRSPVPGDVLTALRCHADRESVDWRRLGDWRYMQWQNLKALPTIGARMRWLRDRLVPSRSQLQDLHGDGSWARLMLRRFGRAIRRVRNKR